MNVTPPRRNAVTSTSFTPFIIKSASLPTSAKIYQAMPLDQELQNELLDATFEESERAGNSDPPYVMFILQLFQLHLQVEAPELSSLSEQLYDHKSQCWQPSRIPFILRAGENIATGKGKQGGRKSQLKASEGGSPRYTNSSQRSLMITRTVEDSDLNQVTETEEGTYIPKSGSEETKLAEWLNELVAAVRSCAPSRSSRVRTRSQKRTLEDQERHWSAEFATRPAPANVDIKMKPDVTLLQKDPFDPDGPNSWRHIVSFIELTSSEDSSVLRKQVTRKAYAIFVSQPGRRFVIALSIFRRQQFRFHLFDRSGAVHSLAYSIHRDAAIFLRVLYMLAFAPEEFVGYDPTIFFSSVITRSVRPRFLATIQVDDEELNITRLIFNSESIRGRGTLCFAVKKASGNKEYVVKISWARIGRAATEEHMLERIKERGLRHGIPTLVKAWTVRIHGEEDATPSRRPDHIFAHLPEAQRPEVRIHRRLLLEPLGIRLDEFSCIQEFVSVFIDILDVHELLVLHCDILHRDISIRNIMMYVFNYDSGQDWSFASKNADILSRLAEREQVLRKHKYRRGLLIDFDYAKFLDDPVVSDGERTGTIPFMAMDILSTFGIRPRDIIQKAQHDLESIIYVIIWICVLYPGPGKPPLPAHTSCLKQWVSCKTCTDVQDLRLHKSGDVMHHDSMEFFTPYFQGFKRYAHRLYSALCDNLNQREALTHDMLRNILLDAFFEVQEPEKQTSFTPGERAREKLGMDMLAQADEARRRSSPGPAPKRKTESDAESVHASKRSRQ